MSSFDKREVSFEKKFALDEEAKFKVVARRNKLLGFWVAEQLGHKGPAADAYVQAVVEADLEEAGDGDMIRKVLADFKAKGIDMSESRIKRRLEEFYEAARKQLTAQ